MDRLLRNNTVLRIIAVVLSCILWLSVNAPASNTNSSAAVVSEKFRAYHVTVKVSTNMVVTYIDSPTVDIVVTGDSPSLQQMQDVSIVADARGLSAGKHTLHLTAVNIPAVNYTIQPATVNVVLEHKNMGQKPIRVEISGKPGVGYEVGTGTTDVQTVEASGPTNLVNDVVAVVAQVSVTGMTQSFTQPVRLQAVDSHDRVVSGVELSPASAMVTVPIEAPKVTSSTAVQLIGSPAAGYAVSGVSVAPQMVTLYGEPSVTAQLPSIDVPVDVTGFHKSQTVHVQLSLPTGITRIQPSVVTVSVTIEQSASTTVTNVPIVIQNAPAHEQITLTGTKQVDVTVAGPKSLIATLKASDISVYVDGSRLQATDTTASLSVILPNWLSATQMSQNSVPVRVTSTGS